MNMKTKIVLTCAGIALGAISTVYTAHPTAPLMAYVAGVAAPLGAYLVGLFQHSPGGPSPRVRQLILLPLLGLMTGCSVLPSSGDDAEPFGDLRGFLRSDVSAALTRAGKATDAGAPFRARCYATLLKHIPEARAAPAGPAPSVAGIVDAFELAAEKIADVQRGTALRIPEDVQADCGYLRAEIRRFMLRAGAKLAPLPGLGAAGGLLR